MRVTVIVGVVFALCLGGCASAGLPDVSDLARDPPLPYSVLVTGGAFIEPGPSAGARIPLDRTFRPVNDLSEAFSLESVVGALNTAAAFTSVEVDDAMAIDRAHRARGTQANPAAEPDVQAYLAAAREAGHDYLLVFERVEDGRVEYREVNKQWPITLVAWVLIGLGALIPDHTYESHASLQAAMRDVRTGATVAGFRVSGGTIDLPLIQRTDFLGFVLSIVVPPFWVGDDDEDVEEVVRELAPGQMLASMVRQLKSPETLRRLERASPGVLRLEQAPDGWLVTVDAEDSLSLVRVRVDGRPIRSEEFDAFERDLLGSVVRRGDHFFYSTVYHAPPTGSRVQLLIQTVTGRVGSVTVGVAR